MLNPAFIPIGVDPPAPLSDAARDAALNRPELSAAWLVHRLREVGIDIDRMTAPRLIDQLLQSATRPIDTVICAALDADPEAAVNGIIATTFADDVRLGVECLAKAVRAARSIIVADTAVRAPKLAGRRGGDNPRLITIDHIYPQLHPALLLRAVLKRKLVAGRLPVEAGVLMLDAAAAWTLGRLVAGNVSVAVPAAVRDHRAGRTLFAAIAPEVAIEAVLSSLQVGIESDDAIVTGELLLRTPANLATPAGKSGLVLHLLPRAAPVAAEPCVRCNWCADVCPTAVLPMLALEAAQFNNVSLADRAGLDGCIECGLCDYVCPSKLPLVAATRIARHVRGAMPVVNG